jgi:hypothetical protein
MNDHLVRIVSGRSKLKRKEVEAALAVGYYFDAGTAIDVGFATGYFGGFTDRKENE